MDAERTGPGQRPECHPPEGGAKQGAQAVDPARRAALYAERAAWTKPMLQALVKGVKGGRWFSLMDKVYRPANLAAAFAKVKANAGAAGPDGLGVKEFGKGLDWHLGRLGDELRRGTYEPQPVRRVYIDKPGAKAKRPLGIPAVRDRVAQTALRNVPGPVFERDFAPHSYGFRPGMGCKDALRHVQNSLGAGKTWVVDADIRGYFDNIDHDILMGKVERKVSDGATLGLLRKYLTAGVLEGTERWTPERGCPQGAVISPLLANIYLDDLDHAMAGAGFEMVRYADDFVVLCDTREEAEAALALVQGWMTRHRLELHPEKTRLLEVTDQGGFDFLGYHFRKGGRRRWPSNKAVKSLRAKVKPLTKRANGHSLGRVIEELNPILRGWFNYFHHTRTWQMEVVDGWVRMRLRSILRKRSGRKGRGRGQDHKRWTNAYFAERGLFCLEHAHVTVLQSLRGNR